MFLTMILMIFMSVWRPSRRSIEFTTLPNLKNNYEYWQRITIVFIKNSRWLAQGFTATLPPVFLSRQMHSDSVFNRGIGAEQIGS